MQNSSFQFSNPVLVNLVFGANKEFKHTPDSPTEIQLSFSININRFPGKNEAVVELTLILGSEDNSNPFYIKATEGAKFKWEDDANSFSDTLLEENAASLLLGYLRPIISTLTASSPFSAYNIPFIDFTKK